MEAKHTPGPWSWSIDTLENRCDQTLYSETSGYSILHCCVKPREPNASLIAAAPALLAAAKSAMVYLQTHGLDSGQVGASLEIAIAKATGA